MSDTCKTCKWFTPTWESKESVWYGCCHRHAPVRTQLAANSNGMTAECEDGWPSVCEMNFCGDFAERKEVA